MRAVLALILLAASWDLAAAADSRAQDHPIDAIVDADNSQLERDRQVVCRRVTTVGSHLKRRVCLPLGTWRKMNWTPPRKKQPKLYEKDPTDEGG